jgi:poly(hydroxyalkanoate) depolymerase family esterase
VSKALVDGMIDATHLTRSGRLGEATNLIQKLLKGIRSPSVAENSHAPRIMDVVAEDVRDPGARDPGTPNPIQPELISIPPTPDVLWGVLSRLGPARGVEALRVLKKSPPPADVVPSVGTFTSKMFSNGAGSRNYKLYVPSGYTGEPRPLIVMLHGCSQTADDFAAGTRMNFAAEEQNCFVVYPEQASTANASRCWNWFNAGDQQRGKGEPALIAGVTRQIMTEYAVDPSRIYIAGLSAGGAAAAAIAEAYPDLYAAVGVHSGLACGVASDMASAFVAMQGRHPSPAPTKASDSPSRPTIVFHGDRDSTVHPRNGAEVVARAGAGGAFDLTVEQGRVGAGHSYTRKIQRDEKGHALIEEWVVHGGGHAWSGGSPSGSYTDPKGPDATKEMLRFFLEHQLQE